MKTAVIQSRDPRIDPHKGDIVSRWPIDGGGLIHILVVKRTELEVSIRQTTRRNVVKMTLGRWRQFIWQAAVKKVAGEKKRKAAQAESELADCGTIPF